MRLPCHVGANKFAGLTYAHRWYDDVSQIEIQISNAMDTP